MKIEWQLRYETSIPEIDEDHRRLVGLINDLDDVIEGDGDLQRIGMVIDALVDYTHYHFTREEALLTKIGYAEAGDHGLAHDQFGHFMGELVGTCILQPSRETAARVRDYLQEWLVDHILVEDMKFVSLAREVA
jgi:hemerythrin